MTAIKPPRFTLREADEAHEAWGANCGPAALAAIVGLTLNEVRPHLRGFEGKGYTNPSMMFDALRSVGVPCVRRGLLPVDDVEGPRENWPNYGLARIQWEGPWTRPGVPLRARYRYTHWIGAARGASGVGVFDVNCLNNGSGWVSLEDWKQVIVPALTASYPRASGGWHVTHAIEVTP